MSDRLLVTGLVVLVARGDGKLRLAPLTLQQSGRVRRFITKLHGGRLHLAQEDLLLLTEADALEAFGKLTGKLPWRERWKRRFVKLKQTWFSYPNPLTKVVRPIGGSVVPQVHHLTVLPLGEEIEALASEE